MRKWYFNKDTCKSVTDIKSPISAIYICHKLKVIFLASWDLFIRGINMETNNIDYQYIASKDRIRAINVNSEFIFCAGQDNVIRAKSLIDGEEKIYLGNTGFIHCLLSKGNLLMSGGD